jgi:hypothetical protein
LSTLESIGRERATFFTADQLVQTEFPEPRWAVHGLIPEGLTLLAGAPKLGKSWLALGMACAIARGAPVLGKIDTAPGPVLYCALEDTPRRLKSRLQILGGTAPAGLSITTALPEMPLAVDLIAEWLDEHRDARLVVVDVLGKIRPAAGTNSDRYEHDYRVIGHLKRLADNYSVAVVVVTHTRKMADGDVFNTVTGSTGLTGAADTTLVLQRARNAMTAALHVTGRDVEESEYALTFDASRGAWDLDGQALAEAAARAAELRATAGLGEDSARVVEYVNSRQDGTRAADVARDLGLTPDTARQYLYRAEESGRIAKRGRGLYGPVTSVTTVTNALAERDTRDGCDSTCEACNQPMWDLGDGSTVHPTCEQVAS